MNILVTAISGNLGQAVCKLIRRYYNDVNIIGIDSINPLQGYGLCNKIIKVPFATEEIYIEYILEIITHYEINLIIPCNDVEAEVLKANDYLYCKTLATKFNSESNIFDKYLCFKEFEKSQINFCKSYIPSNYTSGIDNIIVKPRRGSGSKGVTINPPNPHIFNDSFIIQEYKRGLELTVPFYVNLNQKLLGFLPLIKFGTAPNNSYQTNFKFNEELRNIILKIIKAFDLKGPCNLQCIINEDGIYPFEMNLRYSGSIDIQDQLGFDILKIGIDEYFSNIVYTNIPIIKSGFAKRIYQSEIFLGINILDETDFTHE